MDERGHEELIQKRTCDRTCKSSTSYNEDHQKGLSGMDMSREGK